VKHRQLGEDVSLGIGLQKAEGEKGAGTLTGDRRRNPAGGRLKGRNTAGAFRQVYVRLNELGKTGEKKAPGYGADAGKIGKSARKEGPPLTSGGGS